MTERPTFESRLEAALTAYADGAPTGVEPMAMTHVAAHGAAIERRRWFTPPTISNRWLVVAVAGLLGVALIAGALVAGSRLPAPDELSEIVPPPNAGPSATPTPQPTVAPLPGDAAIGVGVGPCAAMVQFLGTWAQHEQDPPVVPGPVGERANGPILVADQGGELIALEWTGDALRRIEPVDVPVPDGPAYVSFPMADGGRIVPSPDGRAIAVEEGDLGPAGCGAPVVKFAHGGMVSPFGVRAFQAVRDVVWAPDGSALYGILRATIGANGEPLVTDDGDVPADPGTVLQWDLASRQVRNLGSPCGTCGLRHLTVSPAGQQLVIWTAGATFAGDLAGEWRSIGDVPEAIGWTPDGNLVTDRYDHIDTVDLDGTVVTTSGPICCHGNGYGGVLSPDGRTVVGSTLRSDFLGRDIVTVDTATGEQRTIAVMNDRRGCAVFGADSTDRADCEARGGPSFGTTPAIPSGTILAWSPDGQSLFIWSQDQGSPDAEIRVWAVDDSSLSAAFPVQGTRDWRPASAVWLPRVP